MVKYLTSRLLIVFLVKFFYNWAFNSKSQLVQFFDFTDGFVLDILSFLLLFLILVLGLFIINLLFTILHLTEVVSFNEIIERIGNKGFLNCLKSYIGNFWSELSENFEIETRLEKYPKLFIVFIFIFLPFSKGNPILNNYYGIYKEYEANEHGGYIENQNYIVHKSNANEINSRMRSLEENADDYDPYIAIKKKGYLFVQAGLIDGYKTYYKGYNGFVSYVECLLFSAIEKLINTIIYFLTPFILCIIIYHYKFKNEKTTNS